MILESQNQKIDDSENKKYDNSMINFFDLRRNSQETNSLKKIRLQFKNKIRIRDLERMKTQKRREKQIKESIEEILQNDFPKEHQDAKNWSLSLVELYKQSKNYQLDPHKLRQIFTLAQRFPNIGTLTLFYLCILHSSSQNVLTLFDLDIWKFLHNILQFPGISMKQNTYNKQQDKLVKNIPSNFSPQIHLNTKFVQTKLIRLTIQTFIILFEKCIGFRNYSINTHQTFTNYIKPVYKKYGKDIKTQIIIFIKAALSYEFKQYSKQYLTLIKLTVDLVIEYKQMFLVFFKNGFQWNQTQTKQSIEQVIKRVKYLMLIMSKIAEFCQCKWIQECFTGVILSKNQNYLNTVEEYLNFGEHLLKSLTINEDKLKQYIDLFSITLQLMHNTMYFYNKYLEYMINDDTQGLSSVLKISQKAVWILEFLKVSQQNRLFIYADKSLLIDIQKLKQLSIFTVINAIGSQFERYQKFGENIVFVKEQNGKQIDFINLLDYFIKRSYFKQTTLYLVESVFSLLKIKLNSRQIDERYYRLKEIVQFICQMFENQIVLQNVKQQICTHVIQLLNLRQPNISQSLNIKHIFYLHCYRFQLVMNDSHLCKSNVLYERLQIIVNIIKSDAQINQNIITSE